MGETIRRTTGTIRVLHVDDEPDFSDLAATFLEREDSQFTVETAPSASDGLDRLADDDFDCIVSDYDMPGQNGIEFLENVRNEYPDLPFILYTGKGSEEIASEAISAGVTDYLQKGSGTDQYTVLANRVRNAVEQFRSQRALVKRNRELRRYKRMVNSMHEAACIYDSEGRFELVNEYLAEWYNRTPEELEGNQSALVQQIHEQADGDPYRELLAGERSEIRGELDGDFPDHGYAVLEYRLTPLRVDGTVEGVVGVARDITDRRERHAEFERKDRAMDAAPVGITISDPSRDDNPLIYVNDRFTELTGYAEEDALGSNCRFLQGEQTSPRSVARMREAIENEEPVTVELRNYRQDGTEFWNRVSIAPVFGDDGELTNYVGFQQDVTGQKEREREYERTVDLLNQTEQIADVGGWEIDPETEAVFWTDHLFEMLGLEYDEEPPLEEALDVYLEEDRSRVENAVEEAITAGEPFEVEARFQRPDDGVGWFRIRGEPTTEDGSVVTLRGAVHDVTDRRRRERVLREMYDIISNPHSSFKDKVQALLELGRGELDTEYGTLSKIRGDEYVFEFVDADDDSVQPGDVVPLSATNCEVAASTEQTLVLGDVERDAPAETDRAGFTEWGISCYIGAPVFIGDDVYGTFCFYDTEARTGQFSDWEETLVDLMSNWVSQELQRHQVNERLQAQNEQLQQFASIVSHDLRNPLSVAEGRLDLAREECESEHLDAVGRSHDRMNALISDLLTLARGGDQVGEMEPIDLVNVLENCWQNVATAEATLTTDVERLIKADPGRLQQLLENIMRNAVEHGGEDVTITVGGLEEGLYVEDDGPGIPEDERDDVFEAGYSTTEEGTGFGLRIVKQVAQAHGWDVRVTDGSEGGARFEITGIEFTVA